MVVVVTELVEGVGEWPRVILRKVKFVAVTVWK